jgi:RecA-family ATPase
VPSTKVDALITGLVNVKPVLVVIDPAVSFGVGEARVNDAEQGLIEAARRIRNALGCAVEYVHHSGKANARDRATDQYSGRGGSALADGARMVSVLAPVTADEWLAETGQELAEDENAIRLALPKLSYCPKQPDILIRRRGYLFEHVEPSTNGKQAAVAANADMIHRLLVSELQAGRRHSKNTLEHQVELKRTDLRAALDWLEACGRLEWRANPSGGQGGRRHYLHPVASPNGNGEANAKGAV